MHSTPTAAKAQRSKPSQAAVCVSAADGGKQKKRHEYKMIIEDKKYGKQQSNKHKKR